MKSLELLVNAVNPLTVGQRVKPHKFALLLAIIDLYDEGSIDTNCLILDERLESLFHRQMQALDPSMNTRDALIEYPFYSLSKDGYWDFKIKPDKKEEFYRIINEQKERFTKRRIQETVECASLSPEFMKVLSDCSARSYLKNALLDRYSFSSGMTNHNDLKESAVACYSEYLTSLISTNIFNENAIAESQAVNPLFRTIHTSHPLVDILDTELRQKTGKHVILTGHAGDGKTTIAVEIIKRLRGFSPFATLDKPLERREEVEAQRLCIIKDFSEREAREDMALIDELKAGQRRFMIISNTGTLLDFFKGNATSWQINPIEVESRILTAISQVRGVSELEFAGVEFIIYNLAYIDNLNLAKAIFNRMLEPENWKGCFSCSREGFCPVKHNVELIRSAQEQVTERLFLLYRRMYEYGSRLTIRQLTSHLAYIITSGINAAHVHKKMLQKKTDFLFFNRLFGDDGKSPDISAKEMKAIVELKRQNLGALFNSGTEMKLWIKPSLHSSIKVFSSAKDLFSDLRKVGMTPLTVSGIGPTPEQARKQARRLLFFFVNDDTHARQLICDFLNSPNILYWQEWQNKDAVLERAYRARFSNMVFHVIQEHFTGVRMPEGIGTQDSRLYITLSRKQSEVRQSAQIVITELDWSQSIILELDRTSNAAGAEYTELALKGQGVLEGTILRLGLPFLDYVTQRHYGEIGNLLNAAYKERLEHFKLQVLKKTASLNDDMMLVRLRNDNRFKRQKFSISDQGVEVFDA
ncbi:MAG: hypothetical protein WCY64_03735 [Candidatus Cloacimonadaceae bacterium]